MWIREQVLKEDDGLAWTFSRPSRAVVARLSCVWQRLESIGDRPACFAALAVQLNGGPSVAGGSQAHILIAG